MKTFHIGVAKQQNYNNKSTTSHNSTQDGETTQFKDGKSPLHPQPMRFGTHHLQPMKNRFFTP
jgi:hypothetical protein